jgi:hypothetical protein
VGDEQMRAAADGSGIVVERDGETYVVAGGTSYLVAEQDRTAVLRAIGLDAAAPVEVRGEWLALFTRGSDLQPLTFDGRGTIEGVDLPAGSVIRPTGGGDSERYLLTADGSLSRLSDLAYRLYLLGGGAGALGDEVEISPAEIGALSSADAAGADDWPQQTLTPLTGATAPCATLAGDANEQRTALAEGGSAIDDRGGVDDEAVTETGNTRVTVSEDGGALVRGGAAGTLTLVDGGGTAYAVPGDPASGAARLGYTASDITTVPAPWILLLPAGPALTPEAAGATPEAQ